MHWKYMELSIPAATTSRLKWTSACVILLPPIPDKQKRAEFRILNRKSANRLTYDDMTWKKNASGDISL